MSLIFTFFNDDCSVHDGAKVYLGDLLENNVTERMAYRIKMKRNQFWLYDGTLPKECGRRQLLYGTFIGENGFRLSSCSGIIRGYNTECDFSMYGYFTSKFKFVDGHTGKEYKWKENTWSSSDWTLTDPDGHKVATFKRSTLGRTMQGRLTIHLARRRIPPHLLALTLVTQKLVHSRVKRRERKEAQDLKKYGYSLS